MREWLQKLVPITIVGALAFGGYSLYRQGVFRHGLKPAMTRMLHHVPYFGSRFKHYRNGRSAPAVAKGHKAYRGRKGHARRHKGARRHHRRGRRR